MLKYLVFMGAVIGAESCLAIDHYICVGGLKKQRLTMTIDLHPESDLTEDILVGTLPTEEGAIDFYVQKRLNDFYFKAQRQNPPYLYISETVPAIPAIRSKKIYRNQEVFIDCKPYSAADFCRYHTC